VSGRPAGGVVTMGVSSVVAAGLTWGGLVVVGRILGVAEFASFMVVWGLFFTATGVLQGIQQETARESTMPAAPEGGRQTGAALATGLGLAVVLLVSGLVWAPPLIGANWPGVLLATCVAVVVYAVANQVNGALATQGSLAALSGAIGLEAVFRTVAVVLVVLVTSNPALWSVALVGGAVAWAVLSPRGDVRAAFSTRLASTPPDFVRRAVLACTAAGCSALFVAGFPVLLRLENGAELGAEAGAFLSALLFTRAPLLLALNSYQGLVVTRFVRAAEDRVRQLVRSLLVVLGLVVVGAPVSILLGPGLQQVVFGQDYESTGWAFAGLVVAGGAVAGLTLSGWAALASDLHVGYVLGWLAATAVTASLVWVPGELVLRSVVALVGGPLVGIGVHLSFMLWRQPSLEPAR
jgi:O-antigen/teichoic acid export membrane protein